MVTEPVIRRTNATDLPDVLALYPQAFPDEELRPLVSDLIGLDTDVMSLVGLEKRAIVAHIVFTACGTVANDRSGALLAPLCVIPSCQRQGWGGLLVQDGLRRLKEAGTKQVFVLGDPAYYQRFGFSPERNVLTPYAIADDWADAWQSVTLASRACLSAGRLLLPDPWMNPALWQP